MGLDVDQSFQKMGRTCGTKTPSQQVTMIVVPRMCVARQTKFAERRKYETTHNSTFKEDRMAKTGREKLLADFQAVIADTEELMKSVSSDSAGKTQALRDKVQENLKQAREYLQDIEEAVVDKSKVAARATDEYVHENAWRTVGIAVGLGILIGMLLRNRD